MADSSLFTVHLVTPERVLVSGPASEVILRTGEGDISFLAGHTPLVGTVEPGVVHILRPEGEEVRVAVHGGFVQVEQGVTEEGEDSASPSSRVTLLIGVAELAEEIDADRARQAREAAEARIAELGGAGRGAAASAAAGSPEGEQPDAELLEAQAELRRAEVRLEAVDAASSTAV